MSKSANAKSVDIAVAVIHYQNNYLLGYRNTSQHQGNRYEFVGGKIETDENPKQGLIREVKEEIGCDLTDNLIRKMGVIRHDYGDKLVALHIFNIQVSQSQFERLQSEKGSEGQAITWVDKADLLANKYPLPDANVRILDWLTLPDTIFISQTLDSFASEELYDEREVIADWLNFYLDKLPENAFFYPRAKSSAFVDGILLNQLHRHRPNISNLIPIYLWQQDLILEEPNKEEASVLPLILHLNHQQLLTLDVSKLPKDYHYFASCHDQNSLSRVNKLAKTHTVMGCFLSPVLPTPTHPDSNGMGWQAFGELAEFADVPVYALGGVGQSDLATAWQYGAVGVAGIRLLNDGQK